jgi:hypothetical protein
MNIRKLAKNMKTHFIDVLESFTYNEADLYIKSS